MSIATESNERDLSIQEHNKESVQELAREFGARKAYRAFPSWTDDLERKIKTDWEVRFTSPNANWLGVREAVKEGWDAMHSQVAPGQRLH